MSKKNLAKLPSLLSLQRLTLVTDGAFFNVGANGEHTPLMIERQGLRGILGAEGNANAKKSNVSNPQQTDVAKKQDGAVGVAVKFEMRMLSIDRCISSCAGDTAQETAQFRTSLNDFAARAKTSAGIIEVTRRIARNIANGSWLWRNRMISSEVTVFVADALTGKTYAFDALDMPLNEFSNYSADEKELANTLHQGLCGATEANLTITAVFSTGLMGAYEVFPSQCYISDKPKGFARPLYRLPLTNLVVIPKTEGSYPIGQAALRDAKIGNRLRNFDTWYAEFEQTGRAIPIEPNGASLDDQRFYRKPGVDGDTAYDMLRKLDNVDPNTEEGMYSIGVLIRGGVYSEGSKNKGASAEKVVAEEVVE